MTRNRSRRTVARSMWASNASTRSSASITARRAFLPAAGRSRCRRDCARCPPTGGLRPGNFAVKRSSNYDITDAALLPGGDVLLLERRFSWSSGLAVRLRRVALGEIKPGAIVDGPVLFDVDLGYEIDNMEGLSA